MSGGEAPFVEGIPPVGSEGALAVVDRPEVGEPGVGWFRRDRGGLDDEPLEWHGVPFAPPRPAPDSAPGHRSDRGVGRRRGLRVALAALAVAGFGAGAGLRLRTYRPAAPGSAPAPTASTAHASAAGGPADPGGPSGPVVGPDGPLEATTVGSQVAAPVPVPAGSELGASGPGATQPDGAGPTSGAAGGGPGTPVSVPTVPTTGRSSVPSPTVPGPSGTVSAPSPGPGTAATTSAPPGTTATTVAPYSTGVTRSRGVNEPPWINNPGQVQSRLGVSTTYQIGVAAFPGETITFSATGLPAGLSLNPATGTVSGVPTQVQTTGVQVTARSSRGPTTTQGFTWVVTRS